MQIEGDAGSSAAERELYSLGFGERWTFIVSGSYETLSYGSLEISILERSMASFV